MAMPIASIGAQNMDEIFDDAEIDATTDEPSPLTAVCRMIAPMAVMEICSPIGRPDDSSRRQCGIDTRHSSRVSRSSGNFFATYAKHITPDNNCAVTVATAAPVTPSENAPTNSRSISTFSTLEIARKYSGVRLSPSDRSKLANRLYSIDGMIPAKMTVKYRQDSSNTSGGVRSSVSSGRVASRVMTVSGTEMTTVTCAAAATHRRSSSSSCAPNSCATGIANPAHDPCANPRMPKMIVPVAPTAANACVPINCPTMMPSAIL